jgi:hypothetical protein
MARVLGARWRTSVRRRRELSSCRDFLAGRAVHAGQAPCLLMCLGWQPVRYESNMPNDGPVLYLPLPGVQQGVVIAVPREARFAWPEELRRT